MSVPLTEQPPDDNDVCFSMGPSNQFERPKSSNLDTMNVEQVCQNNSLQCRIHPKQAAIPKSEIGWWLDEWNFYVILQDL